MMKEMKQQAEQIKKLLRGYRMREEEKKAEQLKKLFKDVAKNTGYGVPIEDTLIAMMPLLEAIVGVLVWVLRERPDISLKDIEREVDKFVWGNWK